VEITRKREPIAYPNAVDRYVNKLDSRRGAVFSSNYEVPGRYTRWENAMVDPPLGITSRGRHLWIEAYNARGMVHFLNISLKNNLLVLRSLHN
jgi:anthranilate synthase